MLSALQQTRLWPLSSCKCMFKCESVCVPSLKPPTFATASINDDLLLFYQHQSSGWSGHGAEQLLPHAPVKSPSKASSGQRDPRTAIGSICSPLSRTSSAVRCMLGDCSDGVLMLIESCAFNHHLHVRFYYNYHLNKKGNLMKPIKNMAGSYITL